MNDKRHGLGVTTETDNSVKSGMWNENKMEGPGKIEYPNGFINLGNFKKGKLEGFGLSIFPPEEGEII